MGQQQLILLVLATVIVGLAIVVGINAFSEGSLKSNADALVQDAVRIASDAQAWKIKPQAFGGQPAGASKQDQADFTGVSFAVLGYPTDGGTPPKYVNENGSCTIEGAATEATITCTSANGTGSYSSLTTDNSVTVKVAGINDDDVETTTVTIGEY